MSQAAPPIPSQAEDASDSEAQLLALEQSIDSLLVDVEKAVVTSDSIDQAVAQAAEALPQDFMAIDEPAGHGDSAASAQASLKAALQEAGGTQNAAPAPDATTSATPAEAPQNELEASIEEALAQAQIAAQEPAPAEPKKAPAAAGDAVAIPEASAADAASTNEREELAGLADLDAKLAELADLEGHDEEAGGLNAAGTQQRPEAAPAPGAQDDAGAEAMQATGSTPAPSDSAPESHDPDALDAAEALGVSPQESSALNAAPTADADALAPSPAPAAAPNLAPASTPASTPAPSVAPEPAAATATAEAEPSGPGLVTRVGGVTVRAMAWPLTLLPTEARDAVGWLALVTLFNAACLWVFVLMRGH